MATETNGERTDPVRDSTQESPVEKRRDVEDPVHHKHHEKVCCVCSLMMGVALIGPSKITFRKFMALVAMAFLWTGSQIPAYLYGGVPPYSKSSFVAEYSLAYSI